MSTNVLPVLFRPTLVVHSIPVDGPTTVERIIQEVCRAENFFHPHNCFFWYKTEEIATQAELHRVGLFPLPNFSKDVPEVRLKFVHQLLGASHISKHVILASPEHINYPELLATDDSSPILRDLTDEIRRNRRSDPCAWTSIALPVFARKSIDFLPTLRIELPEILQRDEWKAFASFVTTDLSVKERDLVVVDIRRETKTIELKFTTNVVKENRTLLKLNKKTLLNELKLTKRFLDIQYPRSKGKVRADLFNFDVDFSALEERTKISANFVDLALQLSERVALIDQRIDEFLSGKTRLISTCLFNSLQHSTSEFVIDHINYFSHPEDSRPASNERILFRAMPALQLDFSFSTSNSVDSPKEAIEKVETNSSGDDLFAHGDRPTGRDCRTDSADLSRWTSTRRSVRRLARRENHQRRQRRSLRTSASTLRFQHLRLSVERRGFSTVDEETRRSADEMRGDHQRRGRRRRIRSTVSRKSRRSARSRLLHQHQTARTMGETPRPTESQSDRSRRGNDRLHRQSVRQLNEEVFFFKKENTQSFRWQNVELGDAEDPSRRDFRLDRTKCP